MEREWQAYVLAGELHRGGDDYVAALREYEAKLRPFLVSKQQAALRMTGFFAPKTLWGMFLRDVATNLCRNPFLARLLLGAALEMTFGYRIIAPERGDAVGDPSAGGRGRELTARQNSRAMPGRQPRVSARGTCPGSGRCRWPARSGRAAGTRRGSRLCAR